LYSQPLYTFTFSAPLGVREKKRDDARQRGGKAPKAHHKSKVAWYFDGKIKKLADPPEGFWEKRARAITEATVHKERRQAGIGKPIWCNAVSKKKSRFDQTKKKERGPEQRWEPSPAYVTQQPSG